MLSLSTDQPHIHMALPRFGLMLQKIAPGSERPAQPVRGPVQEHDTRHGARRTESAQYVNIFHYPPIAGYALFVKNFILR